MKNKYISILMITGLLFTLTSCSDYLNVDRYFNDRMNEEKLFEKESFSDQWLAGVYARLKKWNMDVASKGNTPHNFSDDMYFGDRNSLYRRLKYGMYSENDFQNSWEECYIGIRDASTFIRNIHINKELNETQIADRRAQARFVRAYLYWLLLRKYGPIPLIPEGEMDYAADYTALSRARSTYEECAVYIAEELALAAADLPLSRTSIELTRPTRGAALAARAKVLLYAASPLANGNTDEYMNNFTDDEGRRLIANEYDESKWARAAAAAKEVMDLGVYELYVAPRRYEDRGRSFPKTIMPPRTEENAEYYDNDWPNGFQNIDPFESYRSLFNGDVQPFGNPELIYTRGTNQGGNADEYSESINDMLRHQVPWTVGGYNCHGITQKQCDAYYMNDGSDIPGKDDYLGRGDGSIRVTGFVTDENQEEYKPLTPGVSLQYAHREPRFYASVAYNGSIWDMNTSSREDQRYYQSWYYHGTSDGKQALSPDLYLRTGIGVKKYYNPQDSYMEGGRTIDKAEPAIRYAEVLLIYAEALNELTSSHSVPYWDGSGSHSIQRDIETMKKAIAPIRIRAGLPNYKSEVYEDANQLRKALKRERQIELFAEGHRYYDLRRWKDAPDEEATPVYGCNVNISESMRNDFYIPVVVPSMPAVFVDKMYFWPISHSELKKNRKLTQAPGWTYYD